MFRVRLLTGLLAAMLVSLVPAAGSAQVVTPAPEGTTWKLTSHAQDGDLVNVPFGVNATLLMLGGQASGSGGCNTFTGTYQLVGPSLTFGDDLGQTLKLCVDADVQAVEEAYLAALPEVASWVMVGDVLQMNDGRGQPLLTFEVPSVGLTSSEVSGLMATLQGLQESISAVRLEVRQLNVDRLRERVKVLEAVAEELRGDVNDLEEAGGAGSQGNDLVQAEGILLEGIPSRIADRCVPLRSTLPKGTLAAVRCTPDSTAIAGLDYYLLDGEDAAAVFTSTMDTFNVPEAVSEGQTCAQGVKSRLHFIGQGWQSEGCYRANSRAEVRFVDNATDCTQLRVGGKRIPSPVFYVALQGSDGDVAAVHAWATRLLDGGSGQITSITQPIKRPGERRSPGCPA